MVSVIATFLLWFAYPDINYVYTTLACVVIVL